LGALGYLTPAISRQQSLASLLKESMRQNPFPDRKSINYHQVKTSANMMPVNQESF
jgi:hypothetical protein